MATKADSKSGVVNMGLLKPFGLFAVDAALLYNIRMKATADNAPYADPVWVPLGMNILYFSMIFFGTKWMEKREPFDIKQWMFAYNLLQTFINLAMVIGFIYQVYTLGMPFWGSGIDRSAKGLGLGFVIYVHYHNKYMEFCDTLFMILRKKKDQLSFLHVYHHSLLTWSWWAVVFWAPGGDAWYGACYNSFIHVLMYSYYLFSTFGVRCPWKKFLTQFQMIQFVCCFAHACYIGFWCDEEIYPKWLVCVQAFVMVNMLVLFGNFYIKSYSKKEKASGSETKGTSPAVGR